MTDVVSAERADVVNGDVVTDAATQSKSTLASPPSTATTRATAISATKLAGRHPVNQDTRRKPATGADPGTQSKASETGSGVGRSPENMGSEPSPPTASAFKVSPARIAADAAVDELDDTPEFEGVGGAYRKSLTAKRIASRIRRTTAGKSAGAHETATGTARKTAKPAAEKAHAARSHALARVATPASQAAVATGQATSAGTVGTAISSAAAPAAGVLAGILAFILGVLILSQLMSAIFGFWEDESLKDTGTLTGVEQEIAAVLKEYGFSNEATAAILGNLKAESDMDPTSDENMDGQFNYAYERACGVFQYTSTSPGTGEYWSFKQWCSDNDKTWSTVEAQMQWTFSGDCPGTWSSRWGTALARSGYYSNCPGYTDCGCYTADEFRTADDLTKATFSWMACYERPANGNYAHLDRRLEYAEGYYEKLTSATYSGSNRIVAAAHSQLGVPYVWGGSTPGIGLDCSGLTQYCYAQAGIAISHYTESQYAELTKVPLSQILPGDILYKPGHVAIYIGNDRYIHEPQSGDVCKISTGTSYFTCALRYTE